MLCVHVCTAVHVRSEDKLIELGLSVHLYKWPGLLGCRTGTVTC